MIAAGVPGAIRVRRTNFVVHATNMRDRKRWAGATVTGHPSLFAIPPMRPILSTIFFDTKHQQLRYRCAIGLYLAILVLGSIPGARAEVGAYATGPVLHSAAYAILTFLLFGSSQGAQSRRAVKAVATVMLMGALDEFVQSFFPYRRGSVIDWLVDCNASMVTALLLWLFWPKEKNAAASS